MQNLAAAKALLIKVKREASDKQQLAQSYENKAILLLKKAQSKALSDDEADRLAKIALSKKGSPSTGNNLKQNLAKQEDNTSKLEKRVGELKSNISKWENELTTLKARSKVAEASKRLNKQLAEVDSSSTLSLLEKMKSKVAEDEALADSYGDMAQINASGSDEDHQIDKALLENASLAKAASMDDSLAALKAKMVESR